MMYIYGDLATKTVARQDAIATQIRQQHNLKQPRGSGDLENKDRIVSEMGNKPNSRSGISE